MPTWPSTLPQAFPVGTNVQVQDVRIRTSVDAGLPKLRRRFTAAIRTYTLATDRFIMTDTQQTTFETFYTTTLEGGTLTFDWTDPWVGAGLKVFRFVSPLQFGMIVPGGANRLTTVSIVLEELP